ncbi:hypothetical protein ACFQ0B_48560 [Nonomuraea thailandensis]
MRYSAASSLSGPPSAHTVRASASSPATWWHSASGTAPSVPSSPARSSSAACPSPVVEPATCSRSWERSRAPSRTAAWNAANPSNPSRSNSREAVGGLTPARSARERSEPSAANG